MFVIAHLTFRETVRRRVLFLTLMLTVIFLVLFTLGVRAAARQISPVERELTASVLGTQLLVLGLFFGNLIVAFLAIFSAVGVVSAELENGVLQTIVTRPLSRAAVIGGKYAGLGTLLVLYAALYFGAILAIVRHYTGTSTTGEPGALALFCLIPLTLLAVTVLGSTSLPTVANGVAALGLYVVAFVGGMVEQVGALIDNLTMQRLGILSSLILPSDALYRKIVAVLTGASGDPFMVLRQLGPLGSLSEPSVWMIVYALLYTAALVALAMRCFAHRDI